MIEDRVEHDDEVPERPRQWTLQSRLAMVLSLLSLVAAGLVGTGLYVVRQQSLMAGIDNQLRTAAVMARAVAGDGYHDRIDGPQAMSDVAYQQLVDRYNRLCQELGMEYLWSLMVVDGKIVFTTSTSPDKTAANRKHAGFFEVHSNPELYQPTFEKMTPTYQVNADKWGRIRVALVPFRDHQGRPYLFGASMRLDEVDQRLRETVYQCLVGSVVLWLGGVAASILLARLVTRPLRHLTETIGEIALGDAARVAEERGSYEQCVLAGSFNRLNRMLQDRLSETCRAQQALRESESQLRDAQRVAGVGSYVLDLATDRWGSSEMLDELFGIDAAYDRSVAGWVALVSPDDRKMMTEYFLTDVLQRGQEFDKDYRIVRHCDQTERWVHGRGKVERDADGRPVRMLGTIRDITEHKLSREALQESLREKELLLKEIHHRVKNNLQIISSLLRLQTHQFDNPEAKAALGDMQDRVRSMALIHDHLYRSENIAAVDMAAYFNGLCAQLSRALVVRPLAVRLNLDLVPVRLDIDCAVPCGMLVSELVSNAFKHAFPVGRAGEVTVQLQVVDGGGLRLRVADDGVGLAPDFDLHQTTSLGMQLVVNLTRQLGGKLTIGDGPGAEFVVEFAAASLTDPI